MSDRTIVKKNVAFCPDCGQKITLSGDARLGQEVICPHCDAELEVVEMDPLELDWIYDEDEGYDEDDEDEDW
jgi:alpha-aminoadipate carrier protein LysW